MGVSFFILLGGVMTIKTPHCLTCKEADELIHQIPQPNWDGYSMNFSTRYEDGSFGRVTFSGEQLKFVLLLKRDLEFWRGRK